MSTLHKNCLLCFKDVNPEEGIDEERVTGLLSSKGKGREIQPLTLFQLVQHPKDVGSPAHQNIIQQHEGVGTCALCDKCAALSEDLAAVGGQIIALQAILRGMVEIMRGRIVESDGEIRSKGLSQQDEGLDGLLAIRQSLLILSDDETDDFSQVIAKVKVEIEEDDIHSLGIFQSYPNPDENEFLKEAENENETDSDCSFSIYPQTTWRNDRASKRKMVEDDLPPTPTPSQVGIKEESSNEEPVRKASRRNSSDISSEIDQEAEYDPLEMDDEIKEEKEGEDEEEEDDHGETAQDCSFLISPDKTGINNRHWEDKIRCDNDTLTKTPRELILPQKTQDATRQNFTAKRTLRIISADTLSSSESDQELEDDPLQMGDELKVKDEKGGDEGDDDESTPESFKCGICARIYDSKTLLDNHVLFLHSHAFKLKFKHTIEKKAQEKPKPSETRQIPLQETKSVRIKRKYPCLVCQRKFLAPIRLQIHMMLKHETKDKPFVCSKCDKRFTLGLNFERHLEGHKVEMKKPVLCEVCDARFQDTSRLKLHSAIHTRKFHCNQCNHSNYTKMDLERHIRTHTGERPFPCDQCEERFIDRKSRKAHTLKMHSTPDQHHLCTLCGKSFYSFLGLRLHLERHQGKRIKCKTCEETFAHGDALARHNILKHGQKHLVCDECGLQVLTKGQLKRHKRIHSDDKPYKCDICDARFKTNGTLKAHMISHSTERPFVCHQCGKGYKSKSQLSTHVKLIHTADYVVPTPFSCPHCGKAYPRQGFLDDHVRQAHTGDRPFVCEVCNKGFAIKAALTQHMKSHGINISREKGPRIARSKRDVF